MRTILIFFSLNLIVLLFSCAEHYDPQLLEAERIIEEYPDSALAIVNGVEQEHRSSPLYGLLYVQARTKTHHIELSDSLIERSAQAFRRNGDRERLMKALFYKGVVETNCKRYDDAIIPLMEAYSMAESKQDYYWMAKSAEAISDIMFFSYMFTEALDYTRRTVEYYKKAGKERNHRFALCELAITYGNIDGCDKGDALFDSVIHLASQPPQDSMLLYYATTAYFSHLVKHDKYAEAQTMIPQMIGYMNPEYTQEVAYMATVETWAGDYENAAAHLEFADKYATTIEEKAEIYNAYSYLHSQQQNYKEALAYKAKLIEQQNELLEQKLNQSIVVEQRNYYDKIAAQEKERAMWLRIWLTAGMVAAALAIAGGTYYHRMRMRLKDMRIEAQMGEILLLQSDVCAGQEQNADMHHRLKLIYRRQWATLNMLNKQLRGLEDSDSSRRRVLRQIESELERMAQPEQLEQLVKEIDSTFGGIIAAAQSDGAIRDDDFTLAALLLARMDTGTICRLTGMKQNTMYSRRRRLKERLEACGSQVAADILRQAAL